MRIVIEIPKEFESHFEFDRLADSLKRIENDIRNWRALSGRYERETISMIRNAFENAIPLPKGHGDLVDLNSLDGLYELDFCDPGAWYEFRKIMEGVNVLVEADKEGAEE